MIFTSKTESLAARVTFAKLYDQKKDIYFVVAEYIISILHELNMTFSIAEATACVNNKYSFNLPEAVVKKSLNCLTKINNVHDVLLKKERDYSIISNQRKDSFSYDNETAELKKTLFIPLIKYIDSKSTNPLGAEEIKQVEHELFLYLIGEEYAGSFSDFISAFIVENENNSQVLKAIEDITDGCILETGLHYDGPPSVSQYHSQNLTLFLDTEIIFSAFGLNGELSKRIFESFLEQVKAINNQTVKNYNCLAIKVFYFDFVKDEVSQYFLSAEKAIEKNLFEPFPREAMKNILDKCKTPSDVVALETKLFDSLEKLNIKPFAEQIDIIKYKDYNLSTQENIDWVERSYGISVEEAYNHLRIMTTINSLRKGISNCALEESSFLFLTGKNIRLSISAKIQENNGGCFLVTTLDWLTNLFWYKLNKGLGKSRPLTFDRVIIAKLMLAARLDMKLSKEYQKLKNAPTPLSEEENYAVIAGFRRKSHHTDDVNAETAPEILDTLISKESYEQFLARQHNLETTLAIREKEKTQWINEKNELEQYRKYTKWAKKISAISFLCFLGVLVASIIVKAIILYYANQEFIDKAIAPINLLLTITGFISLILGGIWVVVKKVKTVFKQ